MAGCLRTFEGVTFRESTEIEVVYAKAVMRGMGGNMSNAFCRIIDEARACTFESLETLVANLHPNNKRLFREIMLKTEVRLWNPITRSVFRFWE